jgi:ATP synthase F1 complex assembly factor 2
MCFKSGWNRSSFDVIDYRLDAFELSAFERAVMTTKSVILSSRLVMEYLAPEKCEGRYGVDGISHLASLEVRFQTQMWGEVEDSMSLV